MSFERLRFHLYKWGAIVGAIVVAGLAAWHSCRTLEPAERTIGVFADENFEKPTAAAMKLINGFAGCELFVEGFDARVLSTDGEPCGATWHPENRTGEHPATAYECPEKVPRFEIHIARPGDIHTQVCIVAHELGHVAGLPDTPGERGIMGLRECPEHIVLSDAEVDHFRTFCK